MFESKVDAKITRLISVLFSHLNYCSEHEADDLYIPDEFQMRLLAQEQQGAEPIFVWDSLPGN